MSLDWDLSGIKNYKELCWGPATDEEGYKLLNGVTDGLIWKTMSVGMGRITEKNYEEFFMRLCMIDVATEGGEGPLNTWVTDEDGKKVQVKGRTVQIKGKSARDRWAQKPSVNTPFYFIPKKDFNEIPKEDREKIPKDADGVFSTLKGRQKYRGRLFVLEKRGLVELG